jgi:acetyltransferase-like isoleucine patch superfamily enzyme
MTTISTLAETKNCTFESADITIGDNAKLTDAHIKAQRIIIKSGAVLDKCKIFSNGQITIGQNAIIKEYSVINAFKSISIGDRTIIDRDVVIGGMQSEKSQIEIGNDCVILYRSYLNTTQKISIGNNVGIGGYSLIFTHSAWQNVLDGNPYKFANVELKDNVWLPWNVTILPGVVIEKDVTVGAGSVVTKSLPPSVIAAGVPAKVIRNKETTQPPLATKNAIMIEIINDFRGYATCYLKLENVKSVNHNDNNFVMDFGNGRLVYTLDFKGIQENDILLSFQIPDNLKEEYGWIELDTLRFKTTKEFAKHFIAFVRRYGIRLKSS